jgi:hypothetical protein
MRRLKLALSPGRKIAKTTSTPLRGQPAKTQGKCSRARGKSFSEIRSYAEPVAALVRPRLAHEFGKTIDRMFGMTLKPIRAACAL